MVCRDAYTHSARDVNPLITSTDAEKQLFALGDSALLHFSDAIIERLPSP